MTKPQLLIAATSSGCGKTTFTLGLLRLLRRRGLSVAGFKCGPDYIDPKYHQLASGQPSTNLDLYMMSPQHVREVYARHSSRADACVVEGVMGLFDGSRGMQGSSAEVAQTLGLPVVLLVNAASSAYSVGAIIYGYKHWKPDVNVVGVVFNRVASANHYSFLADAARDAGVPTLGYIPRTDSLDVPSRHLGLSLEELERLDHFPDRVADLLEQYVEVDRLLELTCIPYAPAEASREVQPAGQMRIAVARDEAFSFIYTENIRTLERLGQVVYFSPLADATLPPACDLVYLPGGYPEFYLDRLAGNASMRASIRAFAECGGRVLAECGGMMYLCRAIIDEAGVAYSMCGVLDNEATMQQMKLTLGYRRLVLPDGREWRGHEFHYSRLLHPGSEPSIAQQYGASGGAVATALYRRGDVLAGYTHLYWAEQDLLSLWD